MRDWTLVTIARALTLALVPALRPALVPALRPALAPALRPALRPALTLAPGRAPKLIGASDPMGDLATAVLLLRRCSQAAWRWSSGRRRPGPVRSNWRLRARRRNRRRPRVCRRRRDWCRRRSRPRLAEPCLQSPVFADRRRRSADRRGA